MMRSEAEIRDKLESLRKQYDESHKNPITQTTEYGTIEYFDEFTKREEQIRTDIQMIDEMAMLEWVLEEKPRWMTSWVRTGTRRP